MLDWLDLTRNTTVSINDQSSGTLADQWFLFLCPPCFSRSKEDRFFVRTVWFVEWSTDRSFPSLHVFFLLSLSLVSHHDHLFIIYTFIYFLILIIHLFWVSSFCLIWFSSWSILFRKINTLAVNPRTILQLRSDDIWWVRFLGFRVKDPEYILWGLFCLHKDGEEV